MECDKSVVIQVVQEVSANEDCSSLSVSGDNGPPAESKEEAIIFYKEKGK